MAASLKLLSVPLADRVARGSRESSVGKPLLSGRLLLMSLWSGLPPFSEASYFVIGFRILDFFLASAAALETSSALRRASVHGLIFTAPVFLLAPSSSLIFLLPELCARPISGGTTSNCGRIEQAISIGS
jgi:hypothetical protein